MSPPNYPDRITPSLLAHCSPFSIPEALVFGVVVPAGTAEVAGNHEVPPFDPASYVRAARSGAAGPQSEFCCGMRLGWGDFTMCPVKA